VLVPVKLDQDISTESSVFETMVGAFIYNGTIDASAPAVFAIDGVLGPLMLIADTATMMRSP
jgi:hypothetical protein